MADKISFRIEGNEDVQRKLNRMADRGVFRDLLKSGVEELKDNVGRYPPAPEPANPDYRYIRGKGTQYVPTGRIQKTSEELKHQFRIESYSTRAILRNVASYATYVIGELQSALHDRTGWKQAGEEAERKANDIARKMSRELKRIWND